MARKIDRTLLSYCPDLQVMDCTLRDGGLVNNFEFSNEFVKDLYEANIKSGVDYMEFGYKASKNLFNVEDFGKWKFCDEESIREIVGENNSTLKISVMADTGRTDYKTDIIPKKDSVVDMYRIATYIHQLPTAIVLPLLMLLCLFLQYTEEFFNLFSLLIIPHTNVTLKSDIDSPPKAISFQLFNSDYTILSEQLYFLCVHLHLYSKW